MKGSKDEKNLPWVEPILGEFRYWAGAETTKRLLTEGKIQHEAVQFMLGKNFRRVFVIVDEAQNLDES